MDRWYLLMEPHPWAGIPVRILEDRGDWIVIQTFRAQQGWLRAADRHLLVAACDEQLGAFVMDVTDYAQAPSGGPPGDPR